MSDFNYKSLTKQELKKIFSGVFFKVEPRWHQFVSICFASNKDRIFYIHGVRTGKTLCSLFTTQLWDCKKILVVCPTSSFISWETDLEKGTDYSYTFLLGTKKERQGLLKKKYDVYISHYEGLKVLFAKLQKGRGWKIDLNSLNREFDAIILDEVHRVSTYNSLQSKICYELSKRTKHIIGMTGTPIDKSLLELFNVEKVIDLGQSLGLNFFNYRREFFYKYGFDWRPKTGVKEKILKKISKNTISFERSECIDLPEVQEEVLKVNPTKEFLDIQEEILNGRILTIGKDRIDCLKENAKIQYLPQLCGGFLYYKNTNGDKLSYHLKENPKLEALLDLVQDTKSKGIIFHRYIEERNLIEELFRENKVPYEVVKGGQTISERVSAIKKFSKDMDSWLISHCQVGSEGWDGSAANIVVFYSPVASPRLREQCVGRISGENQKKKCLVLDLVICGSVDEKIISHRKEYMSLVKIVREFLRDREI